MREVDLEHGINGLFAMLELLTPDLNTKDIKTETIRGINIFLEFWNFFADLYISSLEKAQSKALGNILLEMEQLNIAAEKAVSIYISGDLKGYELLVDVRNKIADAKLKELELRNA